MDRVKKDKSETKGMVSKGGKKGCKARMRESRTKTKETWQACLETSVRKRWNVL